MSVEKKIVPKAALFGFISTGSFLGDDSGGFKENQKLYPNRLSSRSKISFHDPDLIKITYQITDQITDHAE